MPIARYNQSADSVFAQIESIQIIGDLDRDKMQQLLPPGAARNAVDCALWDLEAKRSGKRAWELANIPIGDQVETSFTISLDTPPRMADAAAAAIDLPILKLKLCGDDSDLARVEAVRAAAPKSTFAHRRQRIVVNSSLSKHGLSVEGTWSGADRTTISCDADDVLETLDIRSPSAPTKVATRLSIFPVSRIATKQSTLSSIKPAA